MAVVCCAWHAARTKQRGYVIGQPWIPSARRQTRLVGDCKGARPQRLWKWAWTTADDIYFLEVSLLAHFCIYGKALFRAIETGAHQTWHCQFSHSLFRQLPSILMQPATSPSAMCSGVPHAATPASQMAPLLPDVNFQGGDLVSNAQINCPLECHAACVEHADCRAFKFIVAIAVAIGAILR